MITTENFISLTNGKAPFSALYSIMPIENIPSIIKHGILSHELACKYNHKSVALDNQNWLLILESIKRINERKYTLAIGRTMIQKLAYILTLEGVNTGFVFNKGSYGPYCGDVKKALSAFSNANLITEQHLGQMIKIDVTNNYLNLDAHYNKFDMSAVEKTVDLFSRIKCTADAELFTTIIFSYHYLKDYQNTVTENDIYKYVIDWKPHWAKDAKQNDSLINAIRDLATLQWIKPISTNGLIKKFEI